MGATAQNFSRRDSAMVYRRIETKLGTQPLHSERYEHVFDARFFE
jgi:hypothetical protein